MKQILYILLTACLISPLVVFSQTITGTIFQDLNFNGTKDAADPGVGGCTIVAYDNNDPIGTPTATATSATGTGNYTLSGLTSGTKYRLEIINPNTWLYPGPNGTGSQTTIRIATTGATSINFGLISPSDYCQSTPDIILPCFVSGNPAGGGTAGSEDALVKVGYTNSGTSPSPVHLERANKIGTVWGAAYQRETNTVFTSAFLKRHTGIGPLGLGGIYRTDVATFNMSVSYADLTTLGVTLAAPADLSYINTTRNPQLPAISTSSSVDGQVLGLIGKVGLGGMTICPTGDTLWAVNLYEKKLIRILLGNPYKASLSAADVTQYVIPDPGCASGSWRPWGVSYEKGKVFVGGVCDAGSGGARSNLRAYVYEFSPVTNTFNGTSVINFALDFLKGATHASDAAIGNRWEPWRDTWADIFKGGVLSAGTRSARPQPMLSDIKFDESGNMILAFTDRGGHQLGTGQRASPDDGKLYNGYINGDLMIAKNNGNGSFTIENNGAITGKTGSGVGNGQGPGGGEFFGKEIYPSTGAAIHLETAMGACIALPGRNEVITISMDPLNVWTGGLNTFNLTNGAENRRYQIYATGPGSNGSQGKANGLGMMTVSCAPAPIEIGNIVWLDSDGDGVQDSDEAGIAGVTVELRRITGNALVGTAVTDNNGFYLFSNATGTSTGAAKYALPTLTYFTNYKVVVLNVIGGSKQVALGTNLLTQSNTGGADVMADLRDSDGTLSGNNAETPTFTTGSGGKNNHTYDFGFKPFVAPPPVLPCTFISGLSANITTICNAARSINFTITHDATLVPAQTMKLVYSTTALTTTQLYSGSGTALTTGIAPVTGQTSKLITATMPFNVGASPIAYFVYVVFETAPVDPTCRPFGLVSPITVNPQVAAATLSGNYFTICDRDDTGTTPLVENVQNLNSLVSGNTSGIWTVNAAPTMSGTFVAGVYTAALGDAGKTFTFTYTLAGTGPAGSDCETKTYNVTIIVTACPCYNTQTICGTETITASVPSAYTVTWYKENGVTDTQIGAPGADMITISATGEYYYTGTDAAGCAVDLCCRILVTQNTIPAVINTNLQTICNVNRPSTAGADNAIDLDDQFVSGNSGGTWTIAPSSPVPSGTFNTVSRVFTAALADKNNTFIFRYTITGVGGCPNLTYDVPVLVASCECPTFTSILTPGLVCSDESYSLTLYHTEAPSGGNVEFYYSTFPFLLAANLYAPNHGGAILIGTQPIGTSGSTTINNVQLPASGQSIVYYIHAIYVLSPAISGCQPFVINESTVTVQGTTVPAVVSAPNVICNVDFGGNGNVLNLMTLVTGNTAGAWSSPNGTANAAIVANVFTATAGMAGQTFILEYTAPGASGPQTSICGDIVYQVSLTIKDCSCPSIDILTTSGTPSTVCSNQTFSVTINHRASSGNLQLYYIIDTGNDGTELTAGQLYGAGNGGATALGPVVSPVANAVTTTVSGLSLPVNTSGIARSYIIYARLATGNPNIANPACLPISQKLISTLPETPTATLASSVSVCEASYNTNQNVINLNTLITAGYTGGTWIDTGNSGGLSGNTFTASSVMAPTRGVANQSSFTFTYKISGAASGNCGDQTYTVTVNVDNCAIPTCGDIDLIAPVNEATCSANPFDVTINHTANIGPLSIYWGESVAYGDYAFYTDGFDNADVHFLADITPAALATTTTATGLTLPVYNGVLPRDLYLYVVLKSTNSSLLIPYCIPYAYNTIQQDPLVVVNAGSDGSVSVCDNSTVPTDLFTVITGEQTGGTWTRLTGTGGTFVAATGMFTPLGATTSTFQYEVLGALSCSNDQSVATVMVGSGPTAKFVAIPAECANLIPQNNGRVVLTAFTNANKFGFSVGNSYGAGPNYAAASNITGINQNLISGITNTGISTYTIRIFNGSDACFRDFIVNVPDNFPCLIDPMGFIYCEESGKVISGGTITVTPPAGATYVITQNGSTGSYQFFTDGTAGVYTMTYTPPPGYMASTNRLPGPTLDPTGQPNPYILGSGSASGTVLDNFTAAANPFYMSFNFESGDPEVLNNNLPLKGCCVAPVLTVQNGAVCAGDVINLTTRVTGNTPTGVLTFHLTQADALAGTNALVNTVIAPAATTTYYVRSTATGPDGSCSDVEPVQITVINPPAALATTNGSVCAGGNIDLNTLVTNTGGGSLSFYTTQANAQAGTNPLGSSTVSPASATNYYVRSAITSSNTTCFSTKETTVTIKPLVCGAITVTGPN
jgi:hypothetical protein